MSRRSIVWAALIAVAMGSAAFGQNLQVDGQVSALGPGAHVFMGKVGIGTTAPPTQLSVEGSGLVEARSTSYGLFGLFRMLAARGSASAPAPLQAGDFLGLIAMQGYGTTGFGNSATADVAAVAEETFSDARRGTALRFATTAPGSNVRVEQVRITGGGLLGIGTAAPQAKVHAEGDGYTEVRATGYGGFGHFKTYASRGTAAQPAATAGGDVIGLLSMHGYGSTGFGGSASADLAALAEETFTDEARGTAVRIATTAPGTTTRVERLRVAGDGSVGIGTSTPAARLDVKPANGAPALRLRSATAPVSLDLFVAVGRGEPHTGTEICRDVASGGRPGSACVAHFHALTGPSADTVGPAGEPVDCEAATDAGRALCVTLGR